MSTFENQTFLRTALMALGIGLVVSGCGGSQDQTAEPAEQPSGVTADVNPEALSGRGATALIDSTVAANARTLSANGSMGSVAAVDSQDAFRFLSQATFGPSPASIAELNATTYDKWIDDQISAPWRALLPRVKSLYQANVADEGADKPKRNEVISAFWREALTGDAQLRWRVAYAWSQIFVYSTSNSVGLSDPFGSAGYYDMLARDGLGTYRQLLESVARHPLMGRYLSHLGNRPADDRTGRVPDENFAREIMQLFSIGLHRLNADGSAQLDAKQRTIPTYDADDVAGMARVFTGLSWNCSEGRTQRCFTNWFQNMGDPYAGTRPMVSYPAYHSTEEKRFLNTVIPAQGTANPEASLKIALDTLANHPNVGPFIGRQLIQRLVTSNPSPGYVAAVTAVFNDNGEGVQGDLSAVIRKILTHSEARNKGAHEGKVREPVLLLTALARAIPTRSLTGDYKFRDNETYDEALGQIPLFAPSVFNYYRPGYAPRGGGFVVANMVAPEMQIVDENSVASYVRFMRRAIEGGFGSVTAVGSGTPDMKLDLSGLAALADEPVQLMNRIFDLLLGAAYPALHAEIVEAIKSIKIPKLNQKRTNQEGIARAKLLRAQMALLLTVAAPEFIVQQ